jgi:hypothetical protein
MISKRGQVRIQVLEEERLIFESSGRGLNLLLSRRVHRADNLLIGREEGEARPSNLLGSRVPTALDLHSRERALSSINDVRVQAFMPSSSSSSKGSSSELSARQQRNVGILLSSCTAQDHDNSTARGCIDGRGNRCDLRYSLPIACRKRAALSHLPALRVHVLKRLCLKRRRRGARWCSSPWWHFAAPLLARASSTRQRACWQR